VYTRQFYSAGVRRGSKPGFDVMYLQKGFRCIHLIWMWRISQELSVYVETVIF
jgi:hypothetical protein